MAIVNIDGIYFGDGSGGKVDLDVVSGKVLQLLSSGTLGVWASATIENPGQVRAGTVYYRITEYLKTSSYTTNDEATNTGGMTTQTPQVRTIPVNIDQRKSAKYKLEDFDLIGISSADELESQIANGLSKSLLARLDLELFENLKTFIKDNEGTNAIVNNNFMSTDLEQMRQNRILLNDTIADIESTLTKDILGTSEFETMTITNKKVYGRLLEGIAASGGSMGTELRIQGQIPGQVIGGNAIIKHIFIGQKVDGKLYTLDKTSGTDYDFSKIVAFMWNRESFAFPVDIRGVKQATDPKDMNMVFGIKFRYGFKVLRKELIKAIITQSLARGR